jgi:hypothetical protein
MTATCISTIRKIGLTLGLALSISTAATASSFAYSARAQQMCMGDAFRLCSSEIPSIARITACMRRNKARVSPGCRAVIDEEEAKLTKTKPVQAAPVEQRPPAASRVEQPAATRTRPVQATPVEQKPTTAPPAEQGAATKPVQTAPVEQTPTTASPVEQPAVTETKPVQAAPVEQKPAAASSVEQPAAAEPKPVQAAPVAQKPVAQSAATETKAVHAAPVLQKPATATSTGVKPVTARSAQRSKPAKLARRQQRRNQFAVAPHIYPDLKSIQRSIGIPWPIPFIIVFTW